MARGFHCRVCTAHSRSVLIFLFIGFLVSNDPAGFDGKLLSAVGVGGGGGWQVEVMMKVS